MEKIVYIDPVGPEGACPEIGDELQKYIDKEEIEITFTHLKKGPSNLEYRHSEAIVIPEILGIISDYEKRGYGGAIIGCYYDPGLYAAREISSKMAVTAPGEASMAAANALGEKFSILIGRKKWISRISENIHSYGRESKLSSLKSLDMEIDDFQGNPEQTLQIMKNKAEEAVEKDGAEVIILGCTMQFGYYKKLQAMLGVPVIDPVIASLKYMQFLLSLKNDTGWTVSKKYAFASPPYLRE